MKRYSHSALTDRFVDGLYVGLALGAFTGMIGAAFMVAIGLIN